MRLCKAQRTISGILKYDEWLLMREMVHSSSLKLVWHQFSIYISINLHAMSYKVPVTCTTPFLCMYTHDVHTYMCSTISDVVVCK